MSQSQGKCEDCGKEQPIWIPPKSEVVRISVDTIEIYPPPGYQYIGKEKGSGNQISMAGAMSACCSCDTTVVSGGSCGITGGLDCDDDCKGKCSKSASIVGKVGPIGRKEIQISGGGFVDITEGIHFEKKGNDFLPLIFEEMFMYPYIARAYNAFLEILYNGDDPTSMLVDKNDGRGGSIAKNGFSFVIVNIFGRGSAIPIHRKLLREIYIDGSSGSCLCDGPESGCTGTQEGGCSKGCAKCCQSLTDKGSIVYSMNNYFY